MHIVHVTEAWNGGIASYINTLLRQQIKQNDITTLTLFYDPALATHGFDDAFYTANNIKCIAYESSRNPAKFWTIAKTLRSQISGLSPKSGSTSPIAIHLHSTFPGVYGRISAPTAKTVYCAHGWSFVQESGTLKKFIYKAIERFLAKRTDAIINISAHEHSEAITAGVSAPVMEVILSGVDDAPKSARIDFNPDKAAFNFGFIGRLDHKKGFDILTAIFAQPDMVDHTLYVIGDSNRDGGANTFPQTENIHYLGWIDHAHLDGYIQKLDAVIVPSRQEGFGLSAVEAMRSGVPAIVSNRGGLPELVTNGKDGFVFDLDNASKDLPSLINSLTKNALSKAGQAARKRYEKKFTAPRFARDILQLYKRLF